jgi:hypothetical protein
MPIGKKVLFGVALLLCASLAFAESVRVKSANVNVRSTPAATAKVVAKLPQGKMLEVIEVSGQWTRITDGAITGWVSSALVERVAEAPAAAPASGSSGASRSSSSTTARSSAPPAHRASHKAASDEKILNFGVGATWENNSYGLGIDGRVLFTPVSTLPELRILGAVDVLFLRPSGSSGTPWQITGNGIYVFRTVSEDIHPYVGAGLVYSHVSVDGFSNSATNFNVTGGAFIKKQFFGELRVVFDSGSTGILITGGLKF